MPWLFYLSSALLKNEIAVPSEMTQSLMLLHSYLLVKVTNKHTAFTNSLTPSLPHSPPPSLTVAFSQLHVKMGNHLNGARLLVRVSNSISKFPARMFSVLHCHHISLSVTIYNVY